MCVIRGIIFNLITVTIFTLPFEVTGGRNVKTKCQVSVQKRPDELIEINQKDLKRLKNLYKPNGFKRYITYAAIENYIRWFERDPNLEDVKFFSLNGDFTDGTFVVTDQNNVYTDTLNDSNNRLNRLLTLIDYSKDYIFAGIRTDLRQVIIDALQEVNVDIVLDRMSLLYYLPKEEALKFDVKELPEGIELQEISDIEDIEKANSVWANRHANSLECLKRMAEYNPQIGAYKKDGTLVAWLFSYPTGFLGPLQVDEQNYGKGYAKLVTKYVSKKVAENGHDVFTSIVGKNIPSRSLFSKLGFKSLGELQRIETKTKMSTTVKPLNKVPFTCRGSFGDQSFFPLPKVFLQARFT